MPRARKTDPQTSKDAAKSVKNITETQRAILKVLVKPATDVDLVRLYKKVPSAPRASESGIRSRRSELVELGLVKDTGFRQQLESGRYAILWRKA